MRPQIIKVDKSDLAKIIAEDIDRLKSENCKLIAVICKTAAQCKVLYNSIKSYLDISLISNQNDIYKGGTVIIPSYLAKDKIIVTDFIESRPFPMNKAKEIMPKLINRLHNFTQFQRTINFFDSMDGIVQRFQAAKFIPENIADEIFQNYAKIKNVYPCHSEDLVSSHNDLKPENYIFDGKDAWIVDWESAFLNDRYLDLAVVANFVVNNDDDEIEYLKSYFGKVPDRYIKARFYLMQQLLHIYYMSIFTLYASKSVPIRIEKIETNFKDFHKQIWEGEIDLSIAENKLQYALVHMNQFLSNTNTERFKDSLKIVSEYEFS